MPFPTPEKIGSKDVYVVERHNHAFAAWAAIRATLERSPILISIDHHTDCHPAFLRWVYKNNTIEMDDPKGLVPALIEERCNAINRTEPDSVAKAVADLKHDEHIDAAIRVGIIDQAYVLNRMRGTKSNEYVAWQIKQEGIPPFLQSPEPSGPFTYTIPSNRIFEIDQCCWIGCPGPHTEDCERPRDDQAIETIYLENRLNLLGEMAKSQGIKDVFSEPYILDIDLDYFHTAKAMQPRDPGLFYEMIRQAVAITVATEPGCVLDKRLEGETITADSLLEQIRLHIEKATT